MATFWHLADTTIDPVSSPELVSRLHVDPEMARQASFALFALTYLEETGQLARRLTQEGRGAAPPLPVDQLALAVDNVRRSNEHLLAWFSDDARRRRLAEVDALAARDLVGWVRAQRLEREEPQVAYELALLALGTELPPVMVRSLRELELDPSSRVAELPDGSGYPTVFLSALRPAWDAARSARLFVSSVEARQLAGWAMVLLTRRLELPDGTITVVDASSRRPFAEEEFNAALAYNPAPWLGPTDQWPGLVRAQRAVVV